MEAALYIRISTEKQELENQRAQLRAWAKQEGHSIIRTYEDIASGKKDYRDRAGLYQLLADIKNPDREYELVVFWALDRLTREGTLKTLQYLEVFKNFGIKYHRPPVKSVTVKKKHAVRGIRLILKSSLLAYLQSLIEQEQLASKVS